MNSELESLIDRHRDLRRSALRYRWLIRGLLVVVLPLALLAAADHAWVLSKPWRWIGFALWMGGLLWMLAGLRRALQKPDRQEAAAQLDASASLEGGYAISTASEIEAPRTEEPEEAALLFRLHEEARRLASTATPAHPWPPRWQAVLVLAGMILLGFAGAFAIGRFLRPWADLPYTSITLAGPERLPIAREAFTITGQVMGRTPSEVNLHVSNGTEIKLPVGPDGRFQHTFSKGVPAPVVLLARGAADGVSAPVEVAFRDLPHPVRYEHRIVPPAYTRMPERTENHAALVILRGSEVRYSVNLSKPARALRMVFDTSDAPVDLEAAAGEAPVWVARLPMLRRTAGYHLEALDEDGVWRSAGEPAQIVVNPDKPPAVEIGEHNDSKLKSPRDTFSMGFTASDDIGLEDVRVRYQRVGDSAWSEKVISLQPGAKTSKSEFKLPLEELKVEPHDLVAVVVEARDGNNLDGPGRGGSDPIVFEVPEDSSLADKQGGGGGGGSQSEQVNPLEIQQQIYKDTLKLSMGRKGISEDDLARRQQDNAGNLSDMAGQMAGQAPPEVIELLKVATKAAQEASMQLQMLKYRRNFQAVIERESAVIDALVKASKLMGDGDPPPPGEGQQGPPKKQFTLKKSSSSSSSPSEEERKEKLEQAVADLEQLLKEQQEINKELADQQGQQGQQGQPGGQSPQELGQRQQAAAAQADAIRQQLEKMGKSPNGADPALAAEQLRMAKQQQASAAAGIARGNAAMANHYGQGAASSVEKAKQLTESLLGQAPGEVTEPQARAAGYQDLIQEYTRRLSYDE
jgi:hypothetical protein